MFWWFGVFQWVVWCVSMGDFGCLNGPYETFVQEVSVVIWFL